MGCLYGILKWYCMVYILIHFLHSWLIRWIYCYWKFNTPKYNNGMIEIYCGIIYGIMDIMYYGYYVLWMMIIWYYYGLYFIMDYIIMVYILLWIILLWIEL